MARTLDKTRPFASVHGGGRARFEQDGIGFDAGGREIATERPGTQAGSEGQRLALPPKAKAPKAAEPAEPAEAGKLV